MTRSRVRPEATESQSTRRRRSSTRQRKRGSKNRNTLILGLLGIATAVTAAAQHIRGSARDHSASGGLLVNHAAVYDTMSRLILGPFYKGIADDVAATAPAGGGVLEVGCGPGHLSIQLAQRHGLNVTGIDLDADMIGHARRNASHESNDAVGNPSFEVADVGSLPYTEESYDLIVSTLSMHHWADPTAGLTEISRVLRPGGKALIWDFRPRRMPFHIDMPDPIQSAQGSPLTIVKSTPWRWPWNLALTQRIELAHTDTIDIPDRVTPTTRG